MFLKNKQKNQKTGRKSIGRTKKIPFYYQTSRYLNKEDSERLNRELTSKETQNITRKSVWRQIPGLIAIIVIIACFFYAITLTSNPKVEVISGSNTSLLRPLAVYQLAARNIINSSLSSRTKLTINTNRIAQQFETQYPEIKSVSLIIPLVNHVPLLEIQPAVPVFILNNSRGSYVIDSSGRAILAEPKAKLASLNLPQITDQSGLPVKLGVQTISDNTISFIDTVTSQFKAKSIPISSMIFPAVPYELDVYLSGHPYYLKFNLLGNAGVEVGTYLAAVKQLGASLPAHYIDLLVDGRAYYQ